MAALGDFLERFYGPPELFQTVYARVLHTTTNSPKKASSGRRPIGRRRRDIEPNGDSSEHLVFWARLPDKVRVESTQEKNGKSECTIEIVNGEAQWQRHADGTVEKGASSKRSKQACRLPTEFQRHFDRRLLRECFAALTLEASGECVVAHRECVAHRR